MRPSRNGFGQALLAAIFITSALVSVAAAQPPASQPQQADPAAAGDLHWSQQLGLATAKVTYSFPLIDRVVLVPDAATFADELGKWSAKGHWPVLIEDDLLTPMFVRRFKPAEVIRRPPLEQALPEDLQARREYFDDIVLRAVGGDPENQTLRELMESVKFTPAGVVVASADDPAWPAAIALAAGHVQPIIWIDGTAGDVDGVMEAAECQKLATQISDGLNALAPDRITALGDGYDTIALCRNVPVAVSEALPGVKRVSGGGQFAEGPISLTDYLGRDATGKRFAFTGWIFGDEVRSAYMAMCSLFLPRDSVLLADGYASNGEFATYTMPETAEVFAQMGFAVQHLSGAQEMSPAGWSRAITAGVSADLVWMNSSGNADFFAVSDGIARPGDVPMLNQPAVVHLIHSWSLRNPTRLDTVGGRWLAHGAYAMVGSCYEPFLSAFQRPVIVARRTLGAVPFLLAARRMPEDGFDMAWRVVTIGDPLMTILPPKGLNIPRVPPPAGEGVNLMQHVREVMKRADTEGDPAAFAEAIRTLDLLGQDQAALQMWRLSRQKGLVSGYAASAALPVLFRARDADGFLEAWNEGGPRTPAMFDMLWHLVGPRASTTLDQEVLTTLTAAIRQDAPAHDVERLAPALVRAIGPGYLSQLIAREMARTTNPDQQRQLREIDDRF